MGAGGGALGLTVAYLNIGGQGTAAPVTGNLVSDLAEVGAYYRRAWGDLRISLRGAGGYAWFNEQRDFLTTGVSETSTGHWNGYFADAHAGVAYELHISRFYIRPELNADYLYLNEDGHSDTGAGPGFDLTIDQRRSERMTGSALLTVGTQYGHDAWFRPELFAGYRQVFFGDIASTTAAFTGGSPFTMLPGDVNGGWIVAGFSLKAGTPLSYVAIEGEADIRNNEQQYDVFLSGRAMF
jgi:outer membrane autotransporter protein